MEITHQATLESLCCSEELPVTIRFGSVVRFKIRDEHVSVLTHSSVKTLLLRNFVFEGESRNRLVRAIQNHEKLKKLELHRIPGQLVLFRLFYRSAVSRTLSHLALGDLSLTEAELILLSRAIAHCRAVNNLLQHCKTPHLSFWMGFQATRKQT